MRLFRTFIPLVIFTFAVLQVSDVRAEIEVEPIWNTQIDSATVVFGGGVYRDNIVIHTTTGFEAYSKNGHKQWTYNYPTGSYTLGLPVIKNNIAVFVIYTGKDAKGSSTGSDALLNALDLNSGNLLWSAYLPQYLPLDYSIIDNKLYVSCQYISKPLKKKHVIKRWMSAPENRRDTWVMCIDVKNGRQRWYQQVKGWASVIGNNGENVYFQEYGSSIDGSYTVITSRKDDDGSLRWTSERFREKLTFNESISQMDGEIFVADSKLVLLEKDNGSTLRMIDVGVGKYTVKNGFFWNITQKVDDGFYLQRINLKDLVEIHEEKISEDVNEYSTWIGKNAFSSLMKSNLAYWFKHQPINDDTKLNYFLKDKKKPDERLYLPVSNPNKWINSEFLENYFILNVFNGVESQQSIYTFADQPEKIISYTGEAGQQPVSVFDENDRQLLTTFDGLVLRIDELGMMNVIAENLNGIAMDILLESNILYVIDSGGIWSYQISEKKEILVVNEPEPIVESEPVALLPIPEPEPEVVVPVEPEYKLVEKEVDGWRIQIMYLTQTTTEKARNYAKESENKTGFPVYVINEGAIKLRVGDFVTEEAARNALTKVKSSGFKDAYLVKSPVIIKEKIQIN